MHARKRRLLRARLRATENADPADPAWESEFSAATTAANLTGRRVVALEQLRAAQVERGGKRDAAVKAAAASWTASRRRSPRRGIR